MFSKISLLALSSLLAAFTLFATPPAARAALLYSGGDVRNVWTYNLYYLPTYFSRAYSNVTVPVGQTWTITRMAAYLADPDPADSNTHSPTALIDIRTGMSTSSTGTQIASATATSTTLADQGYKSFGWEVYDWDITLSTPITLTGGQTYWIAVTPNHPQAYNAGMMWSTGTNTTGGPVDNYSLWWDNQSTTTGIIRTENTDYALRIYDATTPEPASLSLLTLGSLPLLRRRRRSAI